MSGMAIKFTSIAQIEANQFVSGDDRLCLGEAEDFEAGVPHLRRSAAGAVSAQALIHYRIYQLDTAGHILAGHSIVCRSDAEAMGAACRFAEQAVAVEVWESARRVGCLETAAAIHRDVSHPHPGNDRFGWRVSRIGRLRHGEIRRRDWLWRLARRRRVLSW